jgi:hypothetical protein
MLMEAHVLMFWQMSGSEEAKLVDLITAIGLQLPCR